MMKIVLDTNVYISGILFGGKSKQIIELVIENKLQLFISELIIEEIKDVLVRPKFGFSQELIRHIIHEIEQIANLVNPKIEHDIVKKDMDDNIIIDCAVEAEANFIITGDKVLQELKRFNSIQIVSPAEFLENLRK